MNLEWHRVKENILIWLNHTESELGNSGQKLCDHPKEKHLSQDPLKL